MKVYKVTDKGQVTLPVEVRERLAIDSKSYVRIWAEGDEIHMRKIDPAEPLGDDDPIWRLVGAGASALGDVSRRHDAHLADAEVEQWKGSSPTRARSTRSSTAATATTPRRRRS
jgi:AbrB family looped-hinge helix DNA binding protein